MEMKVKRYKTLLVLMMGLGIFLGSTLSAASASVYQHAGSTDPTTEGWSIYAQNSTYGPVNDGGVEAWFTSDEGSSSGDAVGYSVNLTPLEVSTALTSGWSFEARLRLPNANQPGAGATAFWFGTGSNRWLLNFSTDADGNQIVWAPTDPRNWTSGLSYNTGSTSYHTYRMVYDTGSGNVDVFVDGVEHISNWAGDGWDEPMMIMFGSGSSPAQGRANWASVNFTVVPVPPSLLLFVSGLIGLAGYGRKKLFKK
jgi:hypothetical protein